MLILLAFIAAGSASMLLAERLVEGHDRRMGRMLEAISPEPEDDDDRYAWMFQ